MLSGWGGQITTYNGKDIVVDLHQQLNSQDWVHHVMRLTSFPLEMLTGIRLVKSFTFWQELERSIVT